MKGEVCSYKHLLGLSIPSTVGNENKPRKISPEKELISFEAVYRMTRKQSKQGFADCLRSDTVTSKLVETAWIMNDLPLLVYLTSVTDAGKWGGAFRNSLICL